ncbi:hypothetical protein AB9M62_57080 [Bacillales bacterium AN1005]
MTIEFAAFKAEVAKGIKIGSDVEVKLLIPLKAAVPYLEFLSSNQGEEVYVHIGDPQAAFDFGDEDRDPMYRTYDGGRRVTTDASGVVTQIDKPGSEPEQDDNQAQLFDGEGNPVQQQEPTGEDEETETGDGQPTNDTPPGDEVHVTDKEDPYGDNEGGGVPSWVSGGGEDQSKLKEMEFGSGVPEGDQKQSDQDPPSGDKQVPAEIDKEQLESFILTQRPIFEDIKLADAPADFPALLQKRNEGKTWMEISKEINVPSSQISNKYGVYKKRVTKMIQDGVAV